MPPRRPIRLDIDPDALPVVTFVLQRTIDELEARAIVAADRDASPSAAVEYRTDIGRLSGLLGQLGHAAGRPDPERAAVVWVDGTYILADGHSVRLVPAADLDRLLTQAIERRRDARLTTGLLLGLLGAATGHGTLEVADRLAGARRSPRDADRHLDQTRLGQQSRELPCPEASPR